MLLTRLFHLSHHTVSLDIDAAEEPEPGAHANDDVKPRETVNGRQVSDLPNKCSLVKNSVT